jgi:RecB family exonuclease
VARVHPPHGFPKTKENPREDRWTCPPGLIEGPQAPDNQTSMLDEERRLFYVACTRAKSRLVLLAKHSGKPSRAAMHFFDELVTTPPADVPLVKVRGDEAISAASRAGLVSRAIAIDDSAAGSGAARIEDVSREFPHRQDMDEVVAGVHRQARLAAAGALERVIAPAPGESASAETLDRAMEAIRRAARHAGAVALANRGDVVPAWMVRGDDELAALVERVRAGAARGRAEDGQVVLAPPAMPLRLSYTSINDYQRCPRCWYAKHVLGLPDIESEQSVVGQAAHGALDRFYRAWTSADAEGQVRPGLPELLRLGRDELVRLAGPRAEALEEQLAQVRAQLQLYFERLHDERTHILETEWNVSFPLAIGAHTHEVIAKIDRLDQMADGSFRVVDYKTGQAWKKLLEPPKDDLQLGIYCLALRAAQGLAEDETLAGTAEYWLLSTCERGVIGLDAIKTQKVLEKIREVVAGIAAGAFPRGERDGRHLCEIL